MRDFLARLERERELLRHLRRPLRQDVLLRQPVKGVVDLERRKLRSVKAEQLVGLKLCGIEGSLPLLERVAARPRQNLHEAFCFLRSDFSGVDFFARLAFSASIRSRILSPPLLGATSDVMSWPSTLR